MSINIPTSATVGVDTAVAESPPEALGLAQQKIEGKSPWVLGWRRLRKDRAAMIALGGIVFIVAVAIFAPVVAAITGHGNLQQFRSTGLDVTGTPVGPNGTFWFGADEQGRDLLVRIAYGARISLIVGVVATALTVLGGTIIGLAAGYFGKIVDSILARFMDWLLAVPFLLFAISLFSVVQVHPIGWGWFSIKPGLPIVIIVLGFFGWASVGRLVRGQVLSIREKEYVEAARALGAGPWRIMVIDILPNLMAPLIVYSTLLIPVTIVGEATLSFLGVGVLPPTADWGAMIGDSASIFLYGPWWYLVFPSAALLFTTLSFNIFGDGVRDAFDPRGDLGI
jgi:ABC-type dipeptide/oligopeptide/nickel transport system permease subunit